MIQMRYVFRFKTFKYFYFVGGINDHFGKKADGGQVKIISLKMLESEGLNFPGKMAIYIGLMTRTFITFF